MNTDRLFQGFAQVTMEHVMRSGSDPITEDLAELDARTDETLREERWDAFAAMVKARKADLGYWSDVLKEVVDALFLTEESELYHWELSSFELACGTFAESEGWNGVLSAIARAMREQAADGR